MEMYLPFGDWSNDGHGRYEKILISAPSMENLLNAQKALKEEYGKFFFNHFANDYEEPHLGHDVWQALLDSNYPVERIKDYDENNDWSCCNSINEILDYDEYPSLSIEFIIDAFIWLLNWKGAEIVRLDEDKSIPMICNWTCPGFKTVGYGCFY